MIEYRSISQEDTEKMGEKLGALLTGGEVICLNGDLGVGKTAFTKGIAKALGINEYITSPTFSLVNEYAGTLPLNHFDVYRIYDEDELLEIGFEDYVYGAGVSVIEWSQLIEGIIPANRVDVIIKKALDQGDNVRIISFCFKGEAMNRLKAIFEESGI